VGGFELEEQKDGKVDITKKINHDTVSLSKKFNFREVSNMRSVFNTLLSLLKSLLSWFNNQLWWPTKNWLYWSLVHWPPVWEEETSIRRLGKMGWPHDRDDSIKYFGNRNDPTHIAVRKKDCACANIYKRAFYKGPGTGYMKLVKGVTVPLSVFSP